MEKFMLIFHGGQMEGMSPQEMQAHMQKWFAWIEKLRKTDQYVTGEPLLPGGKFVSGKSGKSIVDGPYTEGKEVVGGFIVIKAKDFAEATTISKNYPDFDYGGSVQVRQVMKLEMQ